MSAKPCKYSNKFKPLVLLQSTKLGKEDFMTWLISSFEEGEQIYKRYESGVFAGSAFANISSKEDSLNQQDSKKPTSSIKSLYIGNDIGYNRVRDTFKRAVTSRTIVDIDVNENLLAEGGWLNPTEDVEKTGYNRMNVNLFNYKVDLANKIMKYFGEGEFTVNFKDSNADEQLNYAISTALTRFENARSSNQKVSKEVYDTYVILSRFNQLLSELTPFVKVKKTWSKTSQHGINMYDYTGPNVQLRTSWSNNDNPVDAFDQFSDLAKVILDVLPEVDEKGNPIEGTSIGVDGFTSVMSSIKSALLYSSAEELYIVSKAYLDGVVDVKSIISAYENYLKRITTGEQLTHGTYLLSKLRGIQKYIFGGDNAMSQESEMVRGMFTKMFLNTEVIEYRTYGIVSGVYGGSNLKDKFLQNQIYDLQDRLRGRFYEYWKDREMFKEKISKYANQASESNDGIYTGGNGANSAGYNIKLANGKVLTITTEIKNGTYQAKGNYDELYDVSEEEIADLVYDLFGYVIPSDFTRIGGMLRQASYNYSALQEWIPIIGAMLDACHPHGILRNSMVNGVFQWNNNKLYTILQEPARILSIIHGAETRHVVKDVNGNNLPLFGQTSLIYHTKEILERYKKQTPKDRYNIFEDSFLNDKDNLTSIRRSILGAPVVREGITGNSKNKKSGQMVFVELEESAVIFDFMNPLLSGNPILLQTTTFADKSRQFLEQYHLDRYEVEYGDKRYTLKQIFEKLISSHESERNEARQVYMDFVKRHRGSRYRLLAENILADYNAVYEKSFTTLSQLDDFLVTSGKTMPDLVNDFAAKGITFAEETHATIRDGIVRVNETVKAYDRIFNDSNLIEKRFDRQKRRYAYNLLQNGVKFNKYNSAGGAQLYKVVQGIVDVNTGSWINEKSGDVILGKFRKKGSLNWKTVTILNNEILSPDYEFVLNPVFESYVLAESLLSTECNEVQLNGVWAHPPKGAKGSDESNGFDMTVYEEAAESARLITQNKRSVTPGASIHKFMRNEVTRRGKSVNIGISNSIEIAVIDDIKAAAWALTGTSNRKLDSMDGAGISNVYQSIIESNSVHDVYSGYDKKTILQSNDPTTGTPSTLKWAVYAILNERRRLSKGSDVSFEELHRAMNRKEFDKNVEVDLQQYFKENFADGFFEFDDETGKYYKITNVIGRRGPYNTISYFKERVECSKDGTVIDPNAIEVIDKNHNIISDWNQVDFNTTKIKNIYDIDQFFGGAWFMESVDGTLDYSMKNQHLITDIICENDLREYMIAYFVNKSACKVGVKNLNNSETWKNPSNVKTFTFDMLNAGIQMNAEHELDDAEVTEMTQLISALTENGYTYDIVNRIYEDIGRVVEESLRKYKVALNTNNSKKVYQLIGQALIDSYKTGSKDTLGLAQAFFAKAEAALRENDSDFTIPFSASTIYGTFISNVSSMLNKKGIRRKYDGIAAVLSPAHDYIQIYSTGGGTYAEFAVDVRNFKANYPLFADTTIDEFIKDDYIRVTDENGRLKSILNPYISRNVITKSSDFDFEDTVYVVTVNPNGSTSSETIRIDDDLKYYRVLDLLNKSNVRVYNWKSKPHNLRQSNIKFTTADGDFNIYNCASVRAATYINEFLKTGNIDPEHAQLIINVLKYSSLQYLRPLDLNQKLSIQEVVQLWNSNSLTTIGQRLDLRETIKNIIQHQLKEMKQSRVLHDLNFDGATILSYEVRGAECVMGRLNAKKFGLRHGDTLADILNGGFEWFYNRLKEDYEEPVINDNSIYDMVVYSKSKKPILIKFADQNVFSNLNITASRNVDTIDGTIYYEDEPIVPEEYAQFYTYREGVNSYEVMVIDDLSQLQKIFDSGTFSMGHVNTSSSSDKIFQIMQYLDPVHTYNVDLNGLTFKGSVEDLASDSTLTSTQKLEILQEIESKNRTWRLNRLAHKRWEAFQKSLELVGTRIPTQAMQSFMPMQVVAFTDSDVNDIYVSRSQFWLQGSDLDIDKVYILGYQIDNDGTVATLSNLQDEFSLDYVLTLSTPDGRTFEFSDSAENAVIITEEELGYATNLLNISTRLNSANLFSRQVPNEREGFAVIKKIIDSGLSKIYLDPNSINMITDPVVKAEQLRQLEFAKRGLKRLLDKHSKSDSTNKDKAIKNRVVYGILETCKDLENQINAFSPIEMDEAKAAAENSAGGEAARHTSLDEPSSKYLMQIQNLVGKECIGIVAVSIKQFFANSAYENGRIENVIDLVNAYKSVLLPAQKAEIANKIIGVLESMAKLNPLDDKWTMLSNINLEKLQDALQDVETIVGTSAKLGYSENGNFRISDFIKDMKERVMLIDTALSLSGLLSASTDNAKELILSKLNATSGLIDIYTYLLTLGVPFKQIANIMTSPMFNQIARLMNGNVYGKSKLFRSLDNVLDFWLNRSAFGIPEFIVKQNLAVANITYKDDSYMEVFNNDSAVDKLLELAYQERINISTKSGDLYDIDIAMLDPEEMQRQKDLGDCNTWIEFLEEAKTRNALKRKLQNENFGEYQKQLAYLNLIRDRVLPGKEEQSMLGRLLGINQGLRTDPYQKYSLFRSLENFINKRVGDNEQFNTFDFLRNDRYSDTETYQEHWIKKYEAVKTSTNILDVITKVPHFASMFSVMEMDEQMLRQQSAKYTAVQEVARKAERSSDRPLNAKEYDQIEHYVSDRIILDFITGIGFQFNVDEGFSSIYTDDRNKSTASTVIPIEIKNIPDIVTFKRWMEDYVLPELKRRYPNSEFLKYFGKAVTVKGSNVRQFYKLPLDMMSIDDSLNTRVMYDNILKDFDENLASRKFQGHNVADLIFLYNLVVNKDAIGKNSLTRFFENLVGSPNSTRFIDAFYKYVSKLDHDEETKVKFVESVIDNSSIEDARAYIRDNVVNTRITSKSPAISNPDFTFNMASRMGSWSIAKTAVSKIELSEAEKTQTIDKSVLLREVISGMPADASVKLVSSEYIKDKFKNDLDAQTYAAFIDNGTVYINRDKASTSDALHEWAHLILSVIRWSPKTKQVYYELVNKVKTHPNYDQIASKYKNRVGADLNEEIFVTIFSKWLDNKINLEWEGTNDMLRLEQNIKDAIGDLFQIDITKTLDLQYISTNSIEDVMRAFATSLVSGDFNYAFQKNSIINTQKVANLKHELLMRGDIETNC